MVFCWILFVVLMVYSFRFFFISKRGRRGRCKRGVIIGFSSLFLLYRIGRCFGSFRVLIFKVV